MTDTSMFPSTTAHFNLPLLFAGQAQKEFFINQSFAMIDGLTRHAVESARNEPPAAADEGECYRVTAPALGGWSGREDNLAIMIGGTWHFIVQSEGMMIFNVAENRFEIFKSGWLAASAPNTPSGGATVDTEARTAIQEIVSELREIGLFA
ncbi:DUF2793 domain-containing protein [Erythrobacter sp. MTPC3]|uniref:DUF2793 domain-containing protein n=1 Tax=Erythrobacter sp. MTPC3 TaxID=3056564 RepID=UPI0036F2BFC7